MTPDQLATRLTSTASLLHANGDLAWQRFYDWSTTGRMPSTGIRGGGTGSGASDATIEERAGDRAAARYHQERIDLTRRIEADCLRLATIIALATPARPKLLGNRDLLAAQVAADGWCVSCFRSKGFLEPVHKGYYRDRCRFCGDWRAAHRADPPVALLELRHNGRRITQGDVDRALGRTG